VPVKVAADEPTSAPTVDEVRRIAAIANPVLRNLEITQSYWRLAVAHAERTGAGANWCAYATWASRQAGSTIRGEDLVDRLERDLGRRRWLLHPFRSCWRVLLRRGLFQSDTRLGRLTAELHTPFDAFERASAAVALGNLKVFAEIGLEFARYLELDADDRGAFERFVERLSPGDPPGGQRYLRQAFVHYDLVRRSAGESGDAELELLANLEVGLHEQTRLQPQIRAALDAAFETQEDLGRRALVALFPSSAAWWPLVRRPVEAAVGAFAAAVQRAGERLARELITESLMVLSLPGRTLALGANLADPYPEQLASPRNRELLELLTRFEPRPPADDGCGARDWGDLSQRMHYIVHLFTAFHLHPELFDAPFTAEQVAVFGRGEVPGGSL
jgi:hypothetical protein